MNQPQPVGDYSYFSFGFADLSAAVAFEALSDERKREICAHAAEYHSAEELKQLIERLR